MKRVCAWCGLPMDEVEPLEDERISHGICPTCEKRQIRQLYAEMTDERLDAALSAVLQGGNLAAKLEAINEYKKRKEKKP